MAMSQETLARRAAVQYEKHLNSLKSVANAVVVLDACSTRELSTIEIAIEGAWLKGLVSDVNPLLERLGYRPVRVTSNMLNANSPRFAIDANTPPYLDPGCESYHSM